jgi:hypothetical protein
MNEAIEVIEKVSRWAESIGARKKFGVSKEEVDNILCKKPSDLDALYKSTLLDYQHVLTCDISNLNTVLNELNSIMFYCDSNINYITCDSVRGMQDMMKHDLKVMIAAKKDRVCSNLLKLKNQTKLKLIHLENCIDIRQKFLNILETVLKGKIYDRSN